MASLMNEEKSETTTLPLDKHSSQSFSEVIIDSETGYFKNIERIRESEYSSLSDTTYLDHAGTTLYAKSLIEHWTAELTGNLFGNPHSFSRSSQLTSRRIDDIRLKVLKFINASSEHFEIVFTANTTAAVKLVADGFRDAENGFWYGYHADSHTSLVGVREVAKHGSMCFSRLEECTPTLNSNQNEGDCLYLISYPGQSNMTGDRIPMHRCETVRAAALEKGRKCYTLFDAAGLVSSTPLDLSNPAEAPDFTVLSFYKIFGFPDLGALIVRKASSTVLLQKRYFAGGTVEGVTTSGKIWHAKKDRIHDALEEGTLPFHNILALDHAMVIHQRLYGSMQNISRHTGYLAVQARIRLKSLRHANGRRVCQVYSSESSVDQGPVVAFNLLDNQGRWISAHEVEKLSIVKGIQLRTGGLCNPGGIADHLNLSSNEIQRNYVAGQRCGGDNDIMEGKPTGAVRISFGAMSSRLDLDTFTKFIDEYYVDRGTSLSATQIIYITPQQRPQFYVESLSVFPIKSCAAFKVPSRLRWNVTPQGLAWDREWCLVHEGTNVALSQKRFPRMALLQPRIDLERRKLLISYKSDAEEKRQIEVSLDYLPNEVQPSGLCDKFNSRESNICGQNIPVQIYTSDTINSFFSEVLEVPCSLARYSHDGPLRYSSLRRPHSTSLSKNHSSKNSIMLSNESPILLISRSSVNRLNEDIKQRNKSLLTKSNTTPLNGSAVPADSFRGNIVIAQNHPLEHRRTNTRETLPESPYIEDSWSSIQINNTTFEALGPCQRCQMVCVDQTSAQRRQEPFSTLAKTRRKDGRVWFGIHLALSSTSSCDARDVISAAPASRTVQVGDCVEYECATDYNGDV